MFWKVRICTSPKAVLLTKLSSPLFTKKTDITDDAVEEAQEPFITPLTFSIPLPETTTAPSIIVGSEPASEMDTTLLEEALLEDLTPVEEGLGRRKLMDAADVLDGKVA